MSNIFAKYIFDEQYFDTAFMKLKKEDGDLQVNKMYFLSCLLIVGGWNKPMKQLDNIPHFSFFRVLLCKVTRVRLPTFPDFLTLTSQSFTENKLP